MGPSPRVVIAVIAGTVRSCCILIPGTDALKRAEDSAAELRGMDANTLTFDTTVVAGGIAGAVCINDRLCPGGESVACVS